MVSNLETGLNPPKWPSEVTGTVVPTSAPHIGHMNHLCDMAEKGRVSLEEMKTLVKDPQFICKKCGRVAHSADNLCEPVPL